MADARYIPKKTKVKMEFAKGITLSDIIMFFIVLMLLILFEQLYSFIVTLVFDLRY